MSVLKKNIGLFVLLFISNFAYAQNCQDSKDAKTDSTYHNRSKCEADTTLTGSYRRILPMSKEPTPAKVSPDLLKYPKKDPYKKKFTNLQIINTIGSHISKKD